MPRSTAIGPPQQQQPTPNHYLHPQQQPALQQRPSQKSPLVSSPSPKPYKPKEGEVIVLVESFAFLLRLVFATFWIVWSFLYLLLFLSIASSVKWYDKFNHIGSKCICTLKHFLSSPHPLSCPLLVLFTTSRPSTVFTERTQGGTRLSTREERSSTQRGQNFIYL